MPKIKICGLTRPADVAVAVSLGADYIGFVLAPSRRQISLKQARQMFVELGHPDQAVAVVVDATDDLLIDIAEAGFTRVQCHGCVPARLPHGLQGWLARSGADWDGQTLTYPWWTWVLDGPQSGSGLAFDWSILALRPPEDRFFLAGGLRPDNVKGVVEQVRPFGVDVSSGVESAPGIKDAALMREFIERTKDDYK